MKLFKNIVVGVNVSSSDRLFDSERPGPVTRLAIERAAQLAKSGQGHLHLLTSLEIGPHAQEMIVRDRNAGRPCLLTKIEKHLETLAQPARDQGVDVTTGVAFGTASRGLIADALTQHRDLVVVGTHEHGVLSRNVLGSTALNLVRGCPVSVLVSRRGAEDASRRVLAAVALDEAARPVLVAANAAAQMLDAELHVLHVVDYSGARVLHMGEAEPAAIAEYRAQRRAKAEEELAAYVSDALGADQVPELFLDFGEDAGPNVDGVSRADAVLATSKRLAADAVVMGTVIHGALSGILLGSTTEAVLTEIDTSLLVVKMRGAD